MIKCTLISLAVAALFIQFSACACVSRPPCTNTAVTRSSWCRGFDIDTNYYDRSPKTGRTREYYLTLEQLTAFPDGVSRTIYAFNSSFPGPTIVADWGDTVKVHITNHLFDARNGTTVHFHGIRQNYRNQMDGVPSITECPVPPGGSTTYTWKGTQYGTSWYHSHIGLQAWDGAAGSIVINGAATANYDHDAGPLLLTDWTHTPVDALYSSALNHGPPTLANGLLNGTNTWTRDGRTLGKKLAVQVNSGESYRLRLINGAIDTHFRFTIDNHIMTVIAADFVPIVPYQTTVLDIAMGCFDKQLLDARHSTVIVLQQCQSGRHTSILHYGATPDTPSSTSFGYVDACVDEPMTSLVPHPQLDAGKRDHFNDEVVGLNRAAGVFLWTMRNDTMASFATHDHVIQLDEANKWEYLIIHSKLPVPHPIHLHGHDFYLLAQDSGPYRSSAAVELSNPPRRDVAVIPTSGHLVIAFKTYNPGAWLVHCHIGWHTDMGLALQFVEQYSLARELVDYDRLNRTCKAWNDYAASEGVVQHKYDDGI